MCDGAIILGGLQGERAWHWEASSSVALTLVYEFESGVAKCRGLAERKRIERD